MKYFIILSLLFSLFIFVINKNCVDIVPDSEEDCVPSTEDSENFCCFVTFRAGRSDYDRDDIEDDKKCLPFDYNGKEELEDIYTEEEKYKSYGYISYYHCNQNDDKSDNDETLCDDIEPDKPSDCKLASTESNNGDMCCYIKEITDVSYCEKHTKLEVDSLVDKNAKNKAIVCISYDSFLKESLLVLILFLIF